MKKMILAVAALGFVLSANVATADEDLTRAEKAEVRSVLASMGCYGWDDVEKEDNGYIEVDDAECRMGTVDIILDYRLRVVSISRH